MTKYVLKNKPGISYFVNPSYDSWQFTQDINKATSFDSLEEAERVARAVNAGSDHTFWEWDETPPEAIVIPLNTFFEDEY